MCNKATRWLGALGILCASVLAAQTQTDWRRVGNSLVDRGLAGLASGPVARVWYSASGLIFVKTSSGSTYNTSDLEHWQAASDDPPAALAAAVKQLPEPGATTRAVFGQNATVYAFGTDVYRSDNGGASWDNLTAFRGNHILGAGLHDLAVAPANSDEIVLAGDSGVFRSVDGGKSWSGLNDGLPNLPEKRILNTPSGTAGVRIALSETEAAEWPPGEKQAWRASDAVDVQSESDLKQALSNLRGAPVTAIAISGDFVYSGMQTGEILVSSDRGVTWQRFLALGAGPVERFWVDANDPRLAVAVLGASPELSRLPAHVLRTSNGGGIWDNLTANLPDVAAYGVAQDTASGAIYVATERGAWIAYADPAALGQVQPWSPLSSFPGVPAGTAVRDVMLDPQGNQLWAAVEGYGVYATLAPHRLRDPRVVSTADLAARAAAPGSLISVLGAQIDSASTGGIPAPVLESAAAGSQIQIPFNVTLHGSGQSISLALSKNGQALTVPPLALTPASPVIFVDRDGSPLLVDADSGVMLDAMTTAHSGARIQILASGLGRVTPDWPAGIPAPADNPPKVTATVHAHLDRAPVEVTRAELAPGYVGFYLVEITVPKIVNYGPAELYIDAGGASSNRVRVYIEP